MRFDTFKEECNKYSILKYRMLDGSWTKQEEIVIDQVGQRKSSWTAAFFMRGSGGEGETLRKGERETERQNK
jgi:hypothetical protein